MVTGISSVTDIFNGSGVTTALKYVGLEISDAKIIWEDDTNNYRDKNKFLITFANGTSIKIWDDEQNCCDYRFMTTDNNIHTIIGYKLVDIVSKPLVVAKSTDEDECHETCFVEIITTGGCITLINHNEHNGYYGGFDVTLEEVY